MPVRKKKITMFRFQDAQSIFDAWNVSVGDVSSMINSIYKRSLEEWYVNLKGWFWHESAFAYIVLIGMALISVVLGAILSSNELTLIRGGTLGEFQTLLKDLENFKRNLRGTTKKMLLVYICLFSLVSFVFSFFCQHSFYGYRAIVRLTEILLVVGCCSNICDSYNVACKKIAKLRRFRINFFPRFNLILLGNFGYKYPDDAAKVEEELVHLRHHDIGRADVKHPRKEDSVFVVNLDTKIIIVLIGMICHYIIQSHDFLSNEAFENQKVVLLVHNFLAANLLVFCIRKTLLNFQTSIMMLLLFLFYNLLIYEHEPCRGILEGFGEFSRFIMIKISPEKQSHEVFATMEWARLEFGDIFFPGQFIAHCYQFDLRNIETDKEQYFLKLPGIYSLTSAVIFVVSLVLHFFGGDKIGGVKVMSSMYVPFLLGGILTLSIWRREFRELINFSIKSKLTMRNVQNDCLGENEAYGSDSDYYISDESEWEQLVEDKLDIDEELIETDSDDLDLLIKDQEQPVFLPITYEFGSDDDDDTYVIGSDESSRLYLSEVESDLSESTDIEIISESSEDY